MDIENLVKTSYSSLDVCVLLKDLTSHVDNLDTLEREKKIQSGVHYSEMLPVEYKPTLDYLNIFQDSLDSLSYETAVAVEILADKILKEKGTNITLVSLARAGTPIGILLKKCFEKKYKINASHYSVSIIRDKGIDINAMNYITSLHSAKSIVFVDGWVGKGMINKVLQNSCETLKSIDSKYLELSSELAVLSDPAFVTSLFGTRVDFLIPSSCLNSTVSGLFSRTLLRDDLIKPTDFHGAVYYGELKDEDKSIEFIDKVSSYFKFKSTLNLNMFPSVKFKDGMQEVLEISDYFKIKDINKIKPGIGETTRVLLRRVPWKILISDSLPKKYSKHILMLAKEKNVEVIKYPLSAYGVVGIIKDMYAES